MPRLTGKDDGAVAVLVAVLMVVLLSFGALVMDVGSWYAEGRQLQNGAQAGAVAVAQGCVASGSCDASVEATGRAGVFADANANDTVTRVTEVCGGNGAPGLPACSSPPAQDLYDCRGPAPAGAPFAQVRTTTLTGDGSDRLPPLLIRAVPGHESNEGQNMRACARASYGGPATITSKLPLTISTCEYGAYVGNPPDPSKFAPQGPYTAPYANVAAFEHVIYFHDTTESGPGCSAGRSGSDDPISGGFGWLDSTSCVATSDITGLFPTDPGASAPSDCANAQLKAMLGQVVAVPIYNGTNGLTGNNGGYYMQGGAAFVLTGYYLGGQYKERSIITGQYPCGTTPTTGSQRCISGFFTQDLTPLGGAIGGPSLGLTVIQITG